MDKNQITGLILMLVLVTVYFQFFAPDPPEIIPENDAFAQIDSLTIQSPNEVAAEVEDIDDSTRQALSILKYGSFSSNALGNETTLEVETAKLKVQFSNKGGFPREVSLNEYTSYDGGPLTLMVPKKSLIDISFEHLGKNIKLSDLYFKGSTQNMGDSTKVTFTLNTQDGRSLKQVYTLYNDRYEMGYELISEGMNSLVDDKDLLMTWNHPANRIEPHLTDPRQRSTVRYFIPESGVDYLSNTSTDFEEETLEQKVTWIAFKQKYFTSAVLAKNNFSSAYVTLDTNEADSSVVKYMTLSADIPYTDFSGGETKFKLYFGPNIYDELDAFGEGFNENLNLGWAVLAVVNKYLILPIWNGLETFISNYGLLIIVLVLIIRLILSPLTYKSHISMAKMRVLKPELDEIKEKHGDKMQDAQKDQMALYQKVGINPVSGCIPMLLQFPILVALFYYIPNAIELRQVSLLWAEDLSTFDSVAEFGFEIPFYGNHISLFTILMSISMLFFTFFNSQTTTVQGPMKSLQYIMPVMLLFFFNSYAAGLTYYYFISNLVSLGQIFLFKRFINEDKIKATLEENKKKNANKKKSKFQTRLEEAMKANEEAKKKQKKKK